MGPHTSFLDVPVPVLQVFFLQPLTNQSGPLPLPWSLYLSQVNDWVHCSKLCAEAGLPLTVDSKGQELGWHVPHIAHILSLNICEFREAFSFLCQWLVKGSPQQQPPDEGRKHTDTTAVSHTGVWATC